MASVYRVGIVGLARPGVSQRLCKVANNHNVLAAASITSKANRLEYVQRPAPFPYWKRPHTKWNQLFDQIAHRFDDNTRLIVVDGPPAVGKSEFGKKLAEKLDMLYMPPPTIDDIYLNPYGLDLRKYDKVMPEGAQSCDLERFLTQPHHKNVPMFQWNMYHLRYDQYANALVHMLSTGQGVVLNRSVYSDPVFWHAMHHGGYISRNALKVCRNIMDYAEAPFCRPHLVIYLDATVDEVAANIKKRNIPYEVNTKVQTKDYLKDLEESYRRVMEDLGTHTYMMVYDWQAAKDVDWIVHDIENFDIDKRKNEDKKLGDWEFESTNGVTSLLFMCTDRDSLCNRLNPLHLELPDEFYYNMDECLAVDEIVREHDLEEYSHGFTPSKDGWKKIMFASGKGFKFPYSLYRRRCRDFEYLEESMNRFRQPLSA